MKRQYFWRLGTEINCYNVTLRLKVHPLRRCFGHYIWRVDSIGCCAQDGTNFPKFMYTISWFADKFARIALRIRIWSSRHLKKFERTCIARASRNHPERLSVLVLSSVTQVIVFRTKKLKNSNTSSNLEFSTCNRLFGWGPNQKWFGQIDDYESSSWWTKTNRNDGRTYP